MIRNDWSTLTSIRLGNDVLAAIEKFVERRPSYTKSAVINQALRKLFIEYTDLEIWLFLNRDNYFVPCDTKN